MTGKRIAYNPYGDYFKRFIEDALRAARRELASRIGQFAEAALGSVAEFAKREAREAIRDKVCPVPIFGISGGIDAYLGLGGTVQLGYSFDPKSGQISAFLSTGVGVGIGGGAFRKLLLTHLVASRARLPRMLHSQPV